MKTTHIIYAILGAAAASTAGYLLYKKYKGGGSFSPANPLPKYIAPGSNIVLPTGPIVKTPASTEPISNTLQKILDNINPITLPVLQQTNNTITQQQTNNNPIIKTQPGTYTTKNILIPGLVTTAPSPNSRLSGMLLI